MVLPNLLTSYKGGSLPAVSRSLIPRLEESDTDLDNRVTPAVPGLPVWNPCPPAHQPDRVKMLWPIIASASHSRARDVAESIEAGFGGTSGSLSHHKSNVLINMS